MQVLEAAVHRLIKAPQSTVCTASPAATSLALGSMLDQLMSALLETYNKRTSQRTGTFDTDHEHFPFSTHLSEHTLGTTSFFDLSVWALNHLRLEMERVFFATGGYIFFAKYRVNAGDFFVVAKLKDSIGQAFSSDLTQVTAARHISTDRLQQMGRVNLQGWTDESGKYLTFVNAREDGKSADYFVRFLGCAEPTNPKAETQKLVHVIGAFCTTNSFDEAATISFKRSAHQHLLSIPKGEGVSIEALANVIMPNDPDTFLQFINDHEDAPTDGATLDGRTLRSLVRYVVRLDGATLSMTSEFRERHAVSVTNDGDLVIRGIDVASVRKQLE